MTRSKLVPIPWENRPKDCSDPVWRYSKNPVIPRRPVPCANSTFNSAVVRYRDGFAGVFRIDDRSRRMQLHTGLSRDGLRWNIEPDPIRFQADHAEIGAFVYGYDPRVCWIEGRYWVTWCNGYHGPTIGVAWTKDFKSYRQLENAFLPFNRNGVLFPRKIGGKYLMLSRPSDNGHTPFGEIFLSQSPDMIYWGQHRWVMKPEQAWESTKIGAGPIPIETRQGWLMIYHGVLTSCNGFVYSFGAALLDLDQPWKVVRRARTYLLSPQTDYECVGDVPNVAFPCAALVDEGDGDRIAIYYGCADSVVGLCFGRISEILVWIKENSKPPRR